MIKLEDVLSAVEEDAHIGFCVVCYAVQVGGVEPDARNYSCDACGAGGVFGAEELLLTFASKVFSDDVQEPVRLPDGGIV